MGKKYQDKGIVLKFEPGRDMEYTYWSSWSRLPDTPENHSIIPITVEPVGEDTGLALNHGHFPSWSCRVKSMTACFIRWMRLATSSDRQVLSGFALIFADLGMDLSFPIHPLSYRLRLIHDRHASCLTRF